MLAVRSDLRNYLTALAAVLAAVVLRFAMDPVLGDHLPYHLFYFAIGAVAAWGGLGPGLLALAIAFVSGNYFFAHPRYSIDLFNEQNLLATVRFLSVGLLLAFLGHWGRSRGVRWRLQMDEAERDLHRTRNEKQQTWNLLASIGDGLITVNADGRVTFMNQVAEQLSGWTRDAASGQYLTRVFPLVDEHTRRPVPNPALLALEQGAVVLLPENVALIARDGTERSIDDSGAPIRDEHGALIGSVLIFRDITERKRRERAATAHLPFVLAGIHLHALDEWQERLTAPEREVLEAECRNWLAREWSLNSSLVRIVALNGFNLIVRQERSEPLPDGATSAYFSVAYERLLN